MNSIAWNGALRTTAFWSLLIAITWMMAVWWPWFDLRLIADVLTEVWHGSIEGVSTPEFAFALAAGLGATALALAVVFALLHVGTIRFNLWRVRKRITRSKSMADFAEQYEAIHQRISRNALISHAWKEFDETLVKPAKEGDPIQNTVRPQSFINIGVAREKLFGLKMMGSIPSYFVGIGLLLTFIGLVLALQKASIGVSSSDAEGMQSATRQLLQVATFKFATSIAGLGASIALSFLFRTYTIMIEEAFGNFCQAVEARLRYTTPQSITVQMNDHLAAQLTELKEINSADFFARMGEAVSPQIQSAFSHAVAPVTQSIDRAVGKMAETSQSGVAELITQFTEGVQGGAGAELKELTGALREMHGSLLVAQRGISDTGEDFGQRMAEAAENLNRILGQASERLNESSEKSGATLAETVQALRQTFERANATVEEELAKSATGASAIIEDAMNRVLERLESQVASLGSGMGAFQDAMERAADQSRAVSEAFGQTAQDLRAASTPLMQSGERIAGATERLSTTVETTVAALQAEQEGAKVLATELQSHIKHLSELWSGYAAQFERIDEELGRAVAKLADATHQQGQTLADYAARVDEGFAKAISNLAPTLESLQQNADGLEETVEDLRRVLVRDAAE